MSLVEVDSGFPGRVLRDAGVACDAVSLAAARLDIPGVVGVTGSLAIAPGFTGALESAKRESGTLECDYVGPEHLLLALLDDQEGVAVLILNGLGVDPRKVRSALVEEIRQNPTPHGVAPLHSAFVGPRTGLEYRGGRLQILGVEIYEVETVVAWRISPIPELGVEHAVTAPGISVDEQRRRFETWLRAVNDVGSFDLTDSLGTRFEPRSSGGGGSDRERTGKTRFVPAPSPAASALIVTWHDARLEIPLAP